MRCWHWCKKKMSSTIFHRSLRQPQVACKDSKVNATATRIKCREHHSILWSLCRRDLASHRHESSEHQSCLLSAERKFDEEVTFTGDMFWSLAVRQHRLPVAYVNSEISDPRARCTRHLAEESTMATPRTPTGTKARTVAACRGISGMRTSEASRREPTAADVSRASFRAVACTTSWGGWSGKGRVWCRTPTWVQTQWTNSSQFFRPTWAQEVQEKL